MHFILLMQMNCSQGVDLLYDVHSDGWLTQGIKYGAFTTLGNKQCLEICRHVRPSIN